MITSSPVVVAGSNNNKVVSISPSKTLHVSAKSSQFEKALVLQTMAICSELKS